MLIDQYGHMPLYNAGITGETQIIGIGDSGLDYNSCYFYDENTTVIFDNTTANTKHR